MDIAIQLHSYVLYIYLLYLIFICGEILVVLKLEFGTRNVKTKAYNLIQLTLLSTCG